MVIDADPPVITPNSEILPVTNSRPKPADFEGFNAHRENKCLDVAQESPLFSDGFRESSTPIRVPVEHAPVYLY